MYAIEVTELEQNLNWDWQVVNDVNLINSSVIYAKTKLARLWGFNRATIRRWVEVAADANTPGFKRGFSRVIRLADCPECEKEIELTELQYLQLNRNWSIDCPHCNNRIKANPHLKEVVDLDQKIPGTHAKVLRIVGWLVNTHGVEVTQKILNDSPEPNHKQIRQAIRKLLIQEA
jgi:DNA-directed RNA polymerase subunit RPC12/RpoP